MRRFCFHTCTLYLFVLCLYAYADEYLSAVKADVLSIPESGEHTEYPAFDINCLAAIGNSQLSNLVLFSVNRFIRKADYAVGVDFDSIRENVGSRWVWDQDSFSVNHIGHPYQGSFYYIAGRANGLSFTESALLTVGGSICWELVYETETPSLNDLLGTTLGGIAMGEMLHRLYMEADNKGFPASFLISPMDAFNAIVTGRKPPRQGTGVNSSEISVETGFIGTRKRFDEHRDDVETQGLSANAGFRIVYGDPYGHETRTPYSHFEQRASIIFSQDYYSFMFFSDGLLFSSSQGDDDLRRTTLGISLHYDLIYSTDVNFSSNSITLTAKHRRRLPFDFIFGLKAHAGFMPIAACDYIFLRYGNAASPHGDEERRDYDLGVGPSLKLAFEIEHRKLGSLEVEYKFYGVYTIPASVPDEGSTGTTLFSILNVSYEYEVWKNVATGISVSNFRRFGYYDDAHDIDERATSVSCFLKYQFL